MPFTNAPTLLSIEMIDGRSRWVSVYDRREPEFDRDGFGGSATSCNAHTLEVAQWPIVTPGFRDEFVVATRHQGERCSGYDGYSPARRRELTLEIFDVPFDGVRLTSEVVDAEALELQPGIYLNPRSSSPMADRRLVLPLLAGNLTVDFSTSPRFPAEA